MVPVTSLSSPVGGRVVLVTEAEVPLADGVGGEARVLEELRHDLDVGGQTAGHQRLDVHVLSAESVIGRGYGFFFLNHENFPKLTCEDTGPS